MSKTPTWSSSIHLGAGRADVLPGHYPQFDAPLEKADFIEDRPDVGSPRESRRSARTISSLTRRTHHVLDAVRAGGR